ncbi:unnamed protein product [Phytophthora lilii]|uniref:Unnamed protein product n=1 Tax=Phytophthora lilii TaxID=2077276 RepID=A0A9W6TME0_9STRA|nr:unnamed protein product [Phytophthora lilii]
MAAKTATSSGIADNEDVQPGGGELYSSTDVDRVGLSEASPREIVEATKRLPLLSTRTISPPAILKSRTCARGISQTEVSLVTVCKTLFMRVTSSR